MSAKRRLVLGIFLAAAVAAPRTALAQPGDMPGEKAEDATRLNAEAQQMFEDGQYAEAARTYARILEVLPENKVNLEERDNTLLIALEVYREAYRKQRAAGDKRAAKLLCTAQGHYNKYLATYREEYGGAMDPSKAALESHDELQKLLSEAETALGAPPCGPPPPPTAGVDTKTPLPPQPPDRPTFPGRSGSGLIIAGALTMTAGLGATSMIIVGGINRRKATRVLDEENDEDATEAEMMMMLDAEKELARENRRRANGLIIAGSVTTAVLLAGGAAMLGIGIKRRMRYMAFTPSMGRGYAGLRLQGRF